MKKFKLLKFMNCSVIESLTQFLAYISSSLVFIIVFIISYDVIARYLFKRPTLWADEISGYLLVGITFLGLAYALKTEAHIRVDIITAKLSPQKEHLLYLGTEILSLFVAIIFTWESYKMVLSSYREGKIALSLLLTPLYLPQLVIPIGLTVLCLQLYLHIFQLLTNKSHKSKNKFSKLNSSGDDG